jgi:glutamate 5-kinase
MTGHKYRQSIPESRRIVVKIGSRVIVQSSGRPDARQIRQLVGDVAAARRAGYEVVMVSSGAIAAGMEALGLSERPTSVPDLQMCAAVGQGRLMARYAELFGREKLLVGQVLLTHDDFVRKVSLTNLRRTMDHLLKANVIPIINENDVVADEEVKADMSLGDNDYLASLVVRQVRADLLVLLSTTDGLKDMSPQGRNRRIPYVENIGKETYRLVAPSKGGLSKGGMDSKLRAAETCTHAGCTVVIANGRQRGVLASILHGDDVGTLFLASPA